eukprot:02705.XXX_16777_17046_1 [CDS] Oithona nana genome sequencing.
MPTPMSRIKTMIRGTTTPVALTFSVDWAMGRDSSLTYKTTLVMLILELGFKLLATMFNLISAKLLLDLLGLGCKTPVSNGLLTVSEPDL